MSKRVIVGLSGGVDSSVSAWLLKQQGYEVIGLFMINWRESTGLLTSECTWEDDEMFVKMICKQLQIPLHVVDLSQQYSQRVAAYLFDEYSKGRTPNPDVLCNREIKFDVFIQEAQKIGCDYVATGHYCRREEVDTPNGKISRLLAGTDPNKDQSYFLCQLSQNQLHNILFPVGNMNKPEVRKIAEREKLANAARKDSQGICFVGKVDLPTFLQQKLQKKEGICIEIHPAFQNKNSQYDTNKEIQDAETLELLAKPHPFKEIRGRKIGTHNGAHFYTIGQRKGLNIGGRENPLYVIGTDVETNIIYLGEGEKHPGLYRPGLFIKKEDTHWVRPDLQMNENEVRSYKVRIRYRQELQEAKLYCKTEGIYIIFTEQQRGITPGQFAVWYSGDELIGSGVIS